MKAAGQTVRPVKGLKKETDLVVIAHHTTDILYIYTYLVVEWCDLPWETSAECCDK